MRFRSPEGTTAWSATSVDATPELAAGVLLDVAGKPAMGIVEQR